MAYSYEILESAKRDFEETVKYLMQVSGGPYTAQNFIAEFERQLEIICENPLIYAVSRLDEIAKLGYRSAFVNNYVLLYFFRNKTVFVAHIFHQRQDYGRLV